MKKPAIMDETYMKERNYRQVMFIRHQNEREERKLDNVLYSKHGIKAIHKFHMDELTSSKNRLMNELMSVRNTTTTTWGYLPPRPGQEHKDTASKADPIEKIIAAEKMMKMASHKKKKKSTRTSPVKSLKDFHHSDDDDEEEDELRELKDNEVLPLKSSPGKLEGLSNLDVKKAKESVFARLTSNKKTTRRSSSLERVDEQHAFMPKAKAASKSPTKLRSNTNSPRKPPTGVLKPMQEVPPLMQNPLKDVPRLNKVVTISIVADEDKTKSTLNPMDSFTKVIDPENEVKHGDASTTSTHQNGEILTVTTTQNADNTTIVTDEDGNSTSISADQNTDNSTGSSTAENPEPVRQVRALTPIKEGTTLTEKSGPGGKKISNRQSSFARSSTRGSIQVKGRKRKNTTKSEEADEGNKHNPDGSLRTVYKLPDFEESLEEAQMARYLRMKMKPWFEREMSVSDVWKDRDKPLKHKIRLK